MTFLLMAWSHIFTYVDNTVTIILCAELECGSMEKLQNYIKFMVVLCTQKMSYNCSNNYSPSWLDFELSIMKLYVLYRWKSHSGSGDPSYFL